MKGLSGSMLLAGFLFLQSACAVAQKAKEKPHYPVPAAERMNHYLPLLQGKRVALLINQTSRVGNTLLLDTLLRSGINVVKVFVPEHGFRGAADAGASVSSGKDASTGLPVTSLYGKNKKPTKAQLEDVDVLVYDLQDVGVRFYTYISTLEYAMEACAETGTRLLLLDRPNPNGFYVDGPVLEPTYKSFVGMQPVPVVYGMTAGEYARMLVGERWLTGCDVLELSVISCDHYNHTSHYSLPVPPSPNLKTMAAVYLYPSLCFFEGTEVSVGRGTTQPFQQWGHPEFKGKSEYFFIPLPMAGATKPPLEGSKCYGQLIATDSASALAAIGGRLNLGWLMTAYRWYPQNKKFFNNFFVLLAGTSQLQRMIQQGKTEGEIRASWQNDLVHFKKIRKKYLIYPDFE